MNRRRTAVLVGGGVLLTVVGAVLLWRGASHGPRSLTVAGILVLLAGLICLRIVYWSIRIRTMTRAGLAMSHPEESTDHPGGGSQGEASGTG
jgi:hypothetical protein